MHQLHILGLAPAPGAKKSLAPYQNADAFCTKKLSKITIYLSLKMDYNYVYAVKCHAGCFFPQHTANNNNNGKECL